MKRKRIFTLEYGIDDTWYVGRINEIPGIFSQGKTLEELKENILDAYKLMLDDEQNINININKKEVLIEV
ncbi:MAG: type II toxin-antitoxin system HicB family antitoxin [Caldisericia bacterium]